MRQSHIILPEDRQIARQGLLFDLPGVAGHQTYDPYPPIHHGADAYKRLVNGSSNLLGLDFEFSPTGKPSIIGVATETEACAIPWTDEAGWLLVDAIKRGVVMSAYAGLSADRPIIEKALNTRTPLSSWSDAMIRHYLLNADFCSAPGKESADEGGSLGLMNLWTASSLTTKIPNWKKHRGKVCDGPCPSCSVFSYCAIDAWSGLQVDLVGAAEMRRFGIPEDLYRDLHELTEMCQMMTEQGVKINTATVAELNKSFDARRETLFPFTLSGKTKHYEQFGPNSPAQILEWFGQRGVGLKAADKKAIRGALEKEARKSGFGGIKELEHTTEELPEVLDALYRLHQYKSSGKGTDSWYAEKYLDKNDFVHPRFITTGTATGRLSGSRPNFQNIPARGWGAEVKKAIVPRQTGYDIVDVDLSQLELRMCLFLSGVDPAIIGKDAFTWLVAQAGGMFTQAAEIARQTERDAAKSTAHGGNYCEGFVVLSPSDLMKPRFKAMIEAGALRPYLKKYVPRLKKDWEYRGGIVAFSGVNLAERIFGDKSYANRAKALMIQEDIYFNKFPMIRDWHMKILEQIEARGYAQSPTGRILRLYGTPEEDAKQTAAFFGQGVSADHVQGLMRNFYREYGREFRSQGVVILLQVHDSLVFEMPSAWSNQKVYDFIGPIMFGETKRLPSFRSTGKIKRGPSYGDLKTVVFDGEKVIA